MKSNKGWVLVTGGSRGIGKALVESLCQAGYEVVFTYKSSEALAQALATDLSAQGHSCVGHRCDVVDAEQVSALALALTKERGGPYAIINNAGVTRDSLLLKMDGAGWTDLIATNLNAAYQVVRAFLPSMLMNGDGCIVQMSSITAFKGNIGQTNYAASKAGLIGMAKSLAVELARFNIRVNAVAPGLIATEMAAEIPEAHMKRLLSLVPLGRMGSVNDVAAMVGYLLGPGGSYLTGQTFVVDGGLTA